MINIYQYKQWVEAYFEATTTEEQEMELKRFLATPEAADPYFDEIKAVMGVTVMLRRKSHASELTIKQTIFKKHLTKNSRLQSTSLKRQMMRWAAVLILGFAMLTPAVVYWSQSENGDCVAYIDGKKITDQAIVIQQMRSTMAETLQDDATDAPATQLRDLFSTPQQ